MKLDFLPDLTALRWRDLFAAAALALVLVLAGTQPSVMIHRQLWAQHIAMLAALVAGRSALMRDGAVDQNVLAAIAMGALSLWVVKLGGPVDLIIIGAGMALAWMWTPASLLVPMLFTLSAHFGLSPLESFVLTAFGAAPFLSWPALQRRFALRGQGPDGRLSIYDVIDIEGEEQSHDG